MLSKHKLVTPLLESIKKIKPTGKRSEKKLKNFSFEWVYDGRNIWIVQLNLIKSKLSSDMIYPGEVESFIQFDVAKGLEELRTVIAGLSNGNIGIELRGDVGITSHFGDVLRNGRIPSKLTRS